MAIFTSQTLGTSASDLKDRAEIAKLQHGPFFSPPAVSSGLQEAQLVDPLCRVDCRRLS